jgi:2-dehydropantoate 2-reductase
MHGQRRDDGTWLLGDEEDVAVHRVRDGNAAQRSVAAGIGRAGGHKTSMLQDLEAGKPLELAALRAAVLELAELVEIGAPHTRTIAAATELLVWARGLEEPR